MANPYGLPENDPLLTGISPFSLREQNQQAANNDAAAKYAQYILSLEREKRLAEAAKAGTAQAPTLGAINQALQDYNLNPAVRRQLEMQRAKISGMSDAQIAKEFPEQIATAPGTAAPNTTQPTSRAPNIPQEGTYDSAVTGAGNIVSGAVRGAGNIVPGLMGFVSNLAGGADSAIGGPIADAAASIEKNIVDPAADWFQTDVGKKEYESFNQAISDENATVDDIVQAMKDHPTVAAGVAAGFLTPAGIVGAGAKTLGKADKMLKIAQAIKKVPLANKIGAGAVTATTLSAGAMGNLGNGVYNQVLEATGDQQQAREAAERTMRSTPAMLSFAVGSIPIAEKIFGPAARKPGFMSWLGNAVKTIGLETAQEGFQEGEEKRAENIGLGLDENTGVSTARKVGAIFGAGAGAVSSGIDAYRGGVDPNAPTNTPPGTTPPGTAAPAGSTAIDTAIATNANLGANVRIAVRNAIRTAKGDPAAAEAKLISLLGKDPYFSSPELKNAIPAFAKARIAAEMAQTGAAPAAPAAAAPAPTGATGAAPAAPVAAPAPAAPAAAPVAPAAAPAAPSPVDLAAAAQATAQSTGNADINSGTVNAAEAKKVTDDLRAATTKAEAQPEKSAAAIAEALLGGKSEAEVADVLQTEQTAAQKARQKMEETLSKVSLLEVDTRAKVRMHAMRNAMARGMDPLRAEEYAGTVARLFAMPDITGLDQADIDARIAASLRTATRQVDALYANPAPAPAQNKGLQNLGTRGERVGVNNAFNEPAIIEGEFADVTPQLALPQLGRQGQELVPTADAKFNGPEPTRPPLALPQLGRQSQELIPTADANFRGLNSGQLQGNNLTPAGLEAFAPNVDPFLQEMQDIQPNNPTLRTRATRGVNAPIEPEINPYEQMLDPIAAQEFEAAIRENTPESLARAQAIVDQAMAEAPAKKPRKKAEPKKSEGKKRPKS